MMSEQSSPLSEFEKWQESMCEKCPGYLSQHCCLCGGTGSREEAWKASRKAALEWVLTQQKRAVDPVYDLREDMLAELEELAHEEK